MIRLHSHNAEAPRPPMKLAAGKLWLGLPFLCVFWIDAGITLANQPDAYWAGDHLIVDEMFPLFAWGLAHGIRAFFLVCGAWLLVFCALILVLPRLLSEILALALVSGHTWGTMTWLVYQLGADYHVCLLFFVFSAAVFILSLRKSKPVRPQTS